MVWCHDFIVKNVSTKMPCVVYATCFQRKCPPPHSSSRMTDQSTSLLVIHYIMWKMFTSSSMFVILRGFYLLISHFQVYGTEAIALVVSLGERRSMDFFVSMEIEWILVTSYFLMLFSLGHKERHVSRRRIWYEEGSTNMPRDDSQW